MITVLAKNFVFVFTISTLTIVVENDSKLSI